MSDIIRLLPDSVANQIAAGEVIQRPASVIKELVENAADAGATEISIFIKDAGRTLIQVIDNGCGMSETDARMAFERHATSKIRKADDLFTLRSMGFRGEALPSICAISQIELRTRIKDSPIGTKLIIEGSKVTLQEPDLCEQGTSLAVRNLFFNVPARRKFLKSDNVELSNIMREFERLALVNNHIRMRLDTGSRTIDLMASTFRQRIENLWKNSMRAELLPVEIDTSLVKISGFISRPEYARRRNALQFLIVNGRNMRHPYFHKAILSCYESLIAADTQPCYFLKFEVDPASIDVNIHPTKNEIKFEYESEIWKLLSTAVKSALGMFSAVPSIDFQSDVLPVEPLSKGQTPTAPENNLEADYNPFRELSSSTTSYRPKSSSSNWESLYQGFLESAPAHSRQPVATELPLEPEAEQSVLTVGSATADLKTAATPDLRPGLMQWGLKYIVASTREGIMIVDQHRAHLKIIFEKHLKECSRSERTTRPVLFPERLHLDSMQSSVMEGIIDEIETLGFRLRRDGDNDWLITSVPSLDTLSGNPSDILQRMIDSVSEEGVNYGQDGSESETAAALIERSALLVARATAIRGGRRLTNDEMEHLIGELFRLSNPSLTPDGHRIYTLLDLHRIENLLP